MQQSRGGQGEQLEAVVEVDPEVLVWVHAAGTLDREVERVSVALARGAGAELIAERFPHCSIAGDALVLPSHSGAPGAVRAGDALVLHATSSTCTQDPAERGDELAAGRGVGLLAEPRVEVAV
jgi:hypothetical protein